MDTPEEEFFAAKIDLVYRLTLNFKSECQKAYKRYIDIHHDSTSQLSELRSIKETDLLGTIRLLVRTGLDLAESIDMLSEFVNDDWIKCSVRKRTIERSTAIHREATKALRDLTESMKHLAETKG